ncbi:MAG TPA: ABC transporter substrate-binding protein [Candidatus Limnocylindrales bacterium]|jgi:putative spermidine/putrescine transport system substrate-binding protein
MITRTRLVAGWVILALATAACSGGGAASSPPASSTPAATSAAPSGGASPSAAADICTAPPRHDGTTVTFVSFGGVYQEAQRKAWLQPYSELTGVTFQEDENSSNATIKSQVEGGDVTWDIVDVGNDFGLNAHADLLEPLDYTLINKDEILEGFAGDYRVADITYGVALAYNTDKTAGVVPEGWADFFDTAKIPGKRGLWKYSEGGVFEFALMADGVAPGDLYPLDLDRAIAKLDTIKDDIVWWTSGAESQDFIGSGEVAMSMIWNGRGWSAKNIDNKPVEIQWNQQILTADYLVVPKGSPNKDVAMEFIAWATCANNNAGPSQYIPYGPTNKNSTANPAMVNDLAVTNQDENTALFDDEYLIDNFDQIDAAFQAWVTQ